MDQPAREPSVPAIVASIEGRSALETERLAAMLDEKGAAVEHQILPAGHGLTAGDVAAAKAWLQEEDARQFA